MREQHDVNVLEHACPNVVSFGAEQFFGHAGPQPDGAGKMFPLHHFLDCYRRDDIQRNSGIMAFAVSWRTVDHRRMIGHAGLLRRLRDIVYVGPERDDWLPLAPASDKCCRDARDATLDLETLLFEDIAQIFRGLRFMKTEFAEAVHGIHHHLRLFLHGVDLAGQIGLHAGKFRRRNLTLRDCAGGDENDGQQFSHNQSYTFTRLTWRTHSACRDVETRLDASFVENFLPETHRMRDGSSSSSIASSRPDGCSVISLSRPR